ncbi:HTTM domain-containing protein [Zobellia galactanivorans]|uniref:Vitamin K-dependent gamma-glutamyl carboxylase n=1 Tax=Zobellia galactanivorans (strain DSM 12802 / CCUG 47099 / CIP 106680 / NCIMB 13871 / Dsij) TaxID=63186 RepID=G0L6K3_ZOBGA|nr:HTTM domain-containing protein [Zobellia galactanivorans]CAZ97005.1 Vitamin K-dependent gamma-glutamyl carboxylase [Zobellia galactanivorans]
MNRFISKHITAPIEAAPLAVFRILFGVMMLLSIVRFWSYGWIEKLYIQPKLFFSYYGFEWVKPLGAYTYLIFIICGLSAIFVALGYRYRMAIIMFFLSFTYIELMDKTTYLNHYYFISLVGFLMIFLPANAYFSLDAKLNPKKAFQKIPAWTVNGIKLMLGIVYFYAGLAKLNSDWLFKAMPLKIWLPSKFDTPLLGQFLHEEWVQYAFSWFGASYDLAIPFLLLYKKTRPFAFLMVVVFHVTTRVLFPIGMFPYVMIVSTLIFFDSSFHHKLLSYVSGLFRIHKNRFDNGQVLVFASNVKTNSKLVLMAVFFVVQLLMPWRYLAYPGELFWTEEGYRFSWRVMLMEKSGYAQFKVVSKDSGRWFYVDNSDFLTPFQEKQMSFQPDFILEYARYLKRHFEKDGHKNVQIFVDCRVALNGRLSTTYIDPKVDLAQERESFEHKSWIIPFTDEIKGI